jgi:hypothetical protein
VLRGYELREATSGPKRGHELKEAMKEGLRAEKPQDAAKEGLRAEIAVSWAEHEAAGLESGRTINGKAASWKRPRKGKTFQHVWIKIVIHRDCDR